MIGFFKKIRDAHGDNSKVEHQDNDLGTTQDIVKKGDFQTDTAFVLENIREFIAKSESSIQSGVPSITEIENSLVDLEVAYCVKSYIREVTKQNAEWKQLYEKAKELMGCNGSIHEKKKDAKWKGNVAELQDFWIQLQAMRNKLKPQGIALNETSSTELESIRTAIQEIGKSHRIQKINGLGWETVTKNPLPADLKYFRSATKPVILRLMEFCFCIFSKTVLVFTLDGKFVTALKRDAFFIRVERDWERAYVNVKRNEYTVNFVAGDSKRIKTGDERFTWAYTNGDGSKATGYINNPCIIYRYDTMEYGKILFCVADFSERFCFSSEKALLAAEKAVAENVKYNVDRKSCNKSNLISLLLMLEPLSEPVKRIEEYYEKLDVPQKKYCYIERS